MIAKNSHTNPFFYFCYVTTIFTRELGVPVYGGDAITGGPSLKLTLELQGFVWGKYDWFCNLRMREDLNKNWLKPHLHT